MKTKKGSWVISAIIITALLFGVLLFAFGGRVGLAKKGRSVSFIAWVSATELFRGEKDIAIEIEPGILLVNLKDEPEWNEEWREIASIASRVLPDHLKAKVAKNKPLKIGLREKIYTTPAYYSERLNAIFLDRRHYGEFPAGKKRIELVEDIFHEIGHAIDADGSSLFLKESKQLSHNGWKYFLNNAPWFKNKLANHYRDNLLSEAFADFFSYSIIVGILPLPEFSFLKDEVEVAKAFSWFRENVFLGEEPNRDLLREFLNK